MDVLRATKADVSTVAFGITGGNASLILVDLTSKEQTAKMFDVTGGWNKKQEICNAEFSDPPAATSRIHRWQFGRSKHHCDRTRQIPSGIKTLGM